MNKFIIRLHPEGDQTYDFQLLDENEKQLFLGSQKDCVSMYKTMRASVDAQLLFDSEAIKGYYPFCEWLDERK